MQEGASEPKVGVKKWSEGGGKVVSEAGGRAVARMQVRRAGTNRGTEANTRKCNEGASSAKINTNRCKGTYQKR